MSNETTPPAQRPYQPRPPAGNPFDQQKGITGVKKILAVSSGKGGVGKSTIAANLAVALSRRVKTGLLDADIYGPSQPRMFGALNQRPQITSEQKLIPITRHGVKLMSIGFVVDEDSAVVWRGPMLFKAIDQFLRDVAWGELDVLVVDLPPGTGDVQLSLVQKVPVDGVIVIATPQNIALSDVKKSVDMFQRIGTPILGAVENMSYLLDEASGQKMALYPKGDLLAYLDAKKIPMLSEMPFQPKIALAAETGVPYIESYPQASESAVFTDLADQILRGLKLEHV